MPYHAGYHTSLERVSKPSVIQVREKPNNPFSEFETDRITGLPTQLSQQNAPPIKLSPEQVPSPENQTTVSDNVLVKLAQDGNQVAFGKLMKLHYERTYRLVYSIVRHEQDARDVCQEVWLTVWRQLKSFRGEAQFSTWVHPISVRRSLDHLRKRRRWYDRFLPLDLTGSGAAEPSAAFATQGPDDDSARGDRIAQVRTALKTLPPKQRAVLALRELEGLSYGEIASAMKIPPGTVMSRIYHARRLLAKKLGVKL